MAEREVIKSRARLFPHPNADSLELCKVGSFQLVVQKGIYQDGDPIIIAPEKAILPQSLAVNFVNASTGQSYLRGTNKDIVGSIRLRGEQSQGVVIPGAGWEQLPFDVDVAAELGITFYEPPVPAALAGDVEPLGSRPHYTYHDLDQFGVYADEFTEGEEVIVTEKVHGSQGVYYRDPEGQWWVTSKGLSRRGLSIKPSASNSYWAAAGNMGLRAFAEVDYPTGELQVFGEVVPVQNGFSYGYSQPTLLIFKVVLDGVVQPYDSLPPWFQLNHAPVLYRGAFDMANVLVLKEGLETVSGRNLHIREGVVLSPATPRRNSEGKMLAVKLISKAYAKKETGEEVS
jgi:RNA ligase (TIGR02306 family)